MRVVRIAAIIAWCAVPVLLGFSPALAEKRVALVIGNGAYQKVGKLPNPTNDAKAISGMLQSAGFDAVELHENLGIREMRRAVNDFADVARDADTAVVYYSGHGMEVNGVNYLIPVDAVLDCDTDVPFEAFSLDNLVQVLEPARRLRLVMLDACRDNPFARSMKRTVGTRAVGRGLAAVEPTSVNTLIGYAAKAGSTALDGEGANSPYAIALLNNLATPGLDLRIAFGRVRDEVLKVTRNKQEPFVYGSLGGGTVSIVDAPGSSATSATPQAPPVQAPNSSVDRAAQAWAATKDTSSVAILEDFIKHFGSTVYGSIARARVEELKRKQVAVAAPQAESKPPGADVTIRASGSISGKWKWQCKCRDGSNWSGGFELTQNSDGVLTGNFDDNEGGGTISGHISTNNLSFVRTNFVLNQKWTGTVSDSARRMQGSLTNALGMPCAWQASRN